MTCRWQWKGQNRNRQQPEVVVQDGGLLCSETGSSNISAVHWDICSKFGMRIVWDVLNVRGGQIWNRKSQRQYKSPTWGETDFHRHLHSSCRPRDSHVCKVLNWNLLGKRFYRSRISHFPIDSCVGLITAQRQCAVSAACDLGRRWRYICIFIKFGTLINIGHTRLAVAKYPTYGKIQNGGGRHLEFCQKCDIGLQ